MGLLVSLLRSADRAEKSVALPALELGFQVSPAVPCAGNSEANPRRRDHLEQPGAAAGAVLMQPLLQVHRAAQVMPGMAVGTIEVQQVDGHGAPHAARPPPSL